MSQHAARLGPVGTFDGRAGSQDRLGRLTLADAMVDLSVVGEHDDAETGERILEVSVSARFPANEVAIDFELPEHGASRLAEALAAE